MHYLLYLIGSTTKKGEIMDTKRQTKSAVLIYISLLLLFGSINFIMKGNIIDIIYIVVILCSGIKCLKYLEK